MAAFGSTLIRPSRREAEEYPKAFYKLLDHFRRRGDLPNDLLAHITGDHSPSCLQNISKKISGQTFKPDARSSILSYIFDVAGLLFRKRRREARAIPDAPFFALLNLYQLADETQDEARAQSVGVYKFWRHSGEHLGEFVLGRMEVTEEPSGALKVQVRQVTQSDQGLRADEKIYSGYMLCLPKMYFILLHGETAHDPRVVFLPTFKVGQVGTAHNKQSMFEGSNLHLLSLEGFVAGIDGGKSFQSPVHFSLVDDVVELAQIDTQIDVIRPGDQRMPGRVADMLERNGPVRRLEPMLSIPGSEARALPTSVVEKFALDVFQQSTVPCDDDIRAAMAAKVEPSQLEPELARLDKSAKELAARLIKRTFREGPPDCRARGREVAVDVTLCTDPPSYGRVFVS